MRDLETIVDGGSVGNTITRVDDDTSGTTSGVKGENGLEGNVKGGYIKGLEAFTVVIFFALLLVSDGF